MRTKRLVLTLAGGPLLAGSIAVAQPTEPAAPPGSVQVVLRRTVCIGAVPPTVRCDLSVPWPAAGQPGVQPALTQGPWQLLRELGKRLGTWLRELDSPHASHRGPGASHHHDSVLA